MCRRSSSPSLTLRAWGGRPGREEDSILGWGDPVEVDSPVIAQIIAASMMSSSSCGRWGKPRGAVVVGQDFRKMVSATAGLPGNRTRRLQDRPTLQEEVAVLSALRLKSFLFHLGVKHFWQGAHAVDWEGAVLRSQAPAPEPTPLTQRRIGHLEDHGNTFLSMKKSRINSNSFGPFESRNRIARMPTKNSIPALHEPGVTVEGPRHVPKGPRPRPPGSRLAVARRTVPSDRRPRSRMTVVYVGYSFASCKDELVDARARRVRQRRGPSYPFSPGRTLFVCRVWKAKMS